LLQRLETDQLPALSVANVRLLLRAVMPLQRLNVKQATDLVIEHLLNRARSRKRAASKNSALQSNPTLSRAWLKCDIGKQYLGLINCGQKSVSTGVPMLESSVLFGIIRQTPAINQLL
jgi:hypothetical protein